MIFHFLHAIFFDISLSLMRLFQSHCFLHQIISISRFRLFLQPRFFRITASRRFQHSARCRASWIGWGQLSASACLLSSLIFRMRLAFTFRYFQRHFHNADYDTLKDQPHWAPLLLLQPIADFFVYAELSLSASAFRLRITPLAFVFMAIDAWYSRGYASIAFAAAAIFALRAWLSPAITLLSCFSALLPSHFRYALWYLRFMRFFHAALFSHSVFSFFTCTEIFLDFRFLFDYFDYILLRHFIIIDEGLHIDIIHAIHCYYSIMLSSRVFAAPFYRW